jgi:DnaK suppressor protein
MDRARARALLAGERARLQRLLQAAAREPQAAELGDEVDDADRRNAEETGLAVDQLLRARWAALQRAEARLAAGSYGRSVRSGQAIPDERLEADPLAELIVESGRNRTQRGRGGRRRGRVGVGQPSLRGPRRRRHHPRGRAGQRGERRRAGPTAEPGHPHRARPAAPVAGSAASLSTAITLTLQFQRLPVDRGESTTRPAERRSIGPQIQHLPAQLVILAVIPPGPTAANQTALNGMPSGGCQPV